MSRRGILSPLTTPNLPQRTSSMSGFISPSTSRHVGLKSPSVQLLATEHDDAAEKRDRRRSRVLELQRTLESPISATERRKSLPLNGLTAGQLAEHYANCIKLSAENKINSKNAFGLHLIDFMSEQLKKKELENFQIASTTLDASAKIYAGRVDAIHAETYKVLTGLGRSSDKNKHSEEGEETATTESPEAAGEDDKQKKKKKTKKKNTVETNLKNLNLKKVDLEVELDPLFHMMSAAFDEGGSSGLLLNTLHCYDDHQGLALDSCTVVGAADERSQSSQERRVDISDIRDLVRGVDIEPLQVCPAFSSFTFTEWDDSCVMEQSSIIPSGSRDHQFDVNAEVEPIHDSVDDNNDDLPTDLGDFGIDGDMDQGDSDTSRTEGEDGDNLAKDIAIGDGKAAQLMESAMKDLTHGTTGTLLQVLAAAPSDYSYFNKSLLRTWAGPTHWRVAPLSKDSRFQSLADKSQKNKAKKAIFKLDYEETKEFENFFKTSKGSTLTKATLTKYSKNRNTLPKDMHYEADKLFRQFVKSKIIIKRQTTTSDNIDDRIENYDYENINDKENFCPKDLDGDDDDSEGGEFDLNFSHSQDSSEFVSQPSMLGNETFDGTMLTGDKLVMEPNKVAKVDIAYAKTAKKLDVKKLKSTMWNILTTEKKTAPSTSEGDNNNGSKDVDSNINAAVLEAQGPEMRSSFTFQEVLNKLPQKVSVQTAKNLSVPIAFVCLLHLANEKTLKIEDCNMADLTITQGI